MKIPSKLWQDNGSLGFGYLHPPRGEPAVVLSRLQDGTGRISVTVRGPTPYIAATTDMDRLADDLHAEGHVVVWTVTGGTYWRLRPATVKPGELMPHRLDGTTMEREGEEAVTA